MTEYSRQKLNSSAPLVLHQRCQVACRMIVNGTLHDPTDLLLHTVSESMQSQATSVEQYLAELPMDRRESIKRLRTLILQNIDPLFEEGMQYGMIGYYVPHSIFPGGYHCDPTQPLPYLCLASQKNYMSLYMNSIYTEEPLLNWFVQAWSRTGKKLDMGKSCIRFKKIEDLALDVISEAIRRVPLEKHVAAYLAVRELQVKSKPSPSRGPVKKTSVSRTETETSTVAKKARSPEHEAAQETANKSVPQAEDSSKSQTTKRWAK